MLILRGTVVDCASRTVLRVLERAIIGIDESGHILFREEEHEEALEPGGVVKLRSGAEVAVHPDCIIKKLPPRGFVCPGLVDTHTRTAILICRAGIRHAAAGLAGNLYVSCRNKV